MSNCVLRPPALKFQRLRRMSKPVTDSGKSRLRWRSSTTWLVRAGFIIGLLFFCARLSEIPWRSAVRGWDNSFYFFWLRSAVEDGDWDFANELAENNTIAPEDQAAARNLPPTEVGRVPNKYGLGWALSSAPFYLVAKGFVSAANGLFGAGWANDGFGPPFQIALQVGQLAYAWLGLFLLYCCLKQWVGDDLAARALALGWLTTPLLYYQSTNLSMSHSLIFSIVAAGIWLALKIERRPTDPRWWALLGAVAGLCLITRYQAVLGLLPPAFLALRAWWNAGPAARSWQPLALAAVAALPFVLLQLCAWQAVYGQWFLFTYGVEGESFSWADPTLWPVLFSPFHGAFYWHPALLLALAAWCLPRLPDSAQFARWPVIVTVLGTWYLYAAWWAWSLGASFGYRGFDVLWPYALIGIGFILSRLEGASRARRSLEIAFCLLAIWNVLLCLTYVIGLTDRNAPVGYSQMVAAIRQLPQALEAWLKLIA